MIEGRWRVQRQPKHKGQNWRQIYSCVLIQKRFLCIMWFLLCDWDQHSGRIGGISTSALFYYKLSQEFNEDMEQVVESFVSVQRQINSLASVALKNRRALDLLTTKKGGTCLFLEEDCCYFVNETGLFQERVREFRDRIKRCKKEL